MNITEQQYNQDSHSPTTGKLYSPSQKWGGKMIMLATGAICTFGSPFANTRESAVALAKVDSTKYNAKIYVFKRSTPCKLVAVVEKGEIV